MLTVADLLSRNAPVPVKIEVDEATAGISVGALLRREGRAPHAADRTLQPRPHQQAGEPADEERGSDRRTMVRRGAIAAGTLLAAGSVFGAAILTDVTPTGNDTGSGGGTEDDGPYAGQGLLDPEAPVVTPPDSVAIDQAASADPLDPGPAAPTAWIPVAFPGALVGAEGGDGTPATDGDDPGSGDPRSGSGSGDDDSPAAAANGGDETARSSGGASTVSDTDSSRSDSSSSDSSLLDRSVLDGSDSGDSEDDAGSSDNSGSSDGDSDSGSDDDDEDRGLVGGLLDTTSNLLFGSNDEDDSNQRSSGDEDEGSDSFSFFSAADEGTSAPQDEDDGESKSVESSSDDADDSDSGDSDSGDGSGDDGDSGDDGGLVGAVGGTVGSLLS